MKKFTQILGMIVATTILATSCKKNNDAPAPAEDNSVKMIQQFFKNNAPQFENFSVNAASGGVLVSSKGTRYTIKPNSLLDANGNPVTGNVIVAVKEISKASEMILGNNPAVTGTGDALQSFGEFQIVAQQNGNNLKLKPDTASAIGVQVRPNVGAGAVMLQQMPLWRGDSSITVTTNGHNDDNLPVTIVNNYFVPKGTTWSQIFGATVTAGGGYYNFRVDSLIRWTNCDALFSQPGTPVTALGYFGNKFNSVTGGSFTSGEPSMLFYKIKNVNTIAKLYNIILNPTAGKEGFLSYQNSFRVGGQGTFLAISAKNGKFYAEMMDVTVPAPASGKNYVPFTFNMQEVTESQLLSLISQMDTK
jgi:hypothetical protein